MSGGALPPEFWTLAGRVAMLVVAEALLVAIVRARRRGPSASRASLWVRAATWIALSVAYFAIGGLGPLPFAVLLAIVAVLALRELQAMLALGGRPSSWPVASAAAVAFVSAAALGGWDRAAVAAVAAVVLTAADAAAHRAPHRAATTLSAALYVGVPLALLAALRRGPDGFAVATWAIVIVSVCDVTSMVGGLAFGRRKLAAALSPNKTVEGTLAGLAGALAAAAVLRAAFPGAPSLLYYGSALAVAASGIGGDLFASLFKRAANRKDFGSALPGHGGVMDRIDSLLFGIPVAWLTAITLSAR